MNDMTITHGQDGIDDRIAIYPRRWKMVLFAIGALLFVIAGLAIGLAGSWEATAAVVIATYAGVPFFGFGFLYFLYRFIIPKPALIVNDEGILDNASVVTAGLILWEEIKDIRATSFGTERMLVILPKDDEAILARQNPVKRLLMRMNRQLGGYIVWIPGNILPMSCEALRDEIKGFRKARRSRI